MKIKYESLDVPEEVMKAFATFAGWQEQILTTSESPNYLIDNPQSFADFIKEKYGSTLSNDLIAFNMQSAVAIAETKRKEAEDIINEAKEQASEVAHSMFTMTVE